jgi:hypothetical protein
MTDPGPKFGAVEVIEIAGKFEADDATFLIGGQATNLWAWFYQEKEQELQVSGPLTSPDIDYFGTQDVARGVAEALGGQISLPEPGDFTPNTAQITTTINGKPLVIDFLGAVLGVQTRELERGVSVIQLTAQVDGSPTNVLIRLLHPLVCLKSRIVNILHPATRRTDRIARAQAEAAIVVLRRFISDALDEPDGWTDVHHCFRQLYHYLRRDEYVKQADLKIGTDPLTILQAFADDPRIDQRYRNMTLKKMIAKIGKRRLSRPVRASAEQAPSGES